MYAVKKLDAEQVKSAKNLLYQVYIKEQGWQLKRNNPSGLYVESDQLHDNFDSRSDWVGAFHNDKLVGCQRFISYPFELTLYRDIPKELDDKSNVETNRLAFVPEYRKGNPLLLMVYMFAIEFMVKNRNSKVFGACSFPNPSEIYRKIGSIIMDSYSFKYNEEDSNEVKMIYYDLSDAKTVEKTRSLVERISSRFM